MKETFLSVTDFSITKNKDRVYKMEKHFHDEIEFYIHINGGKYCFIEDCVYEIHKGDIIVFDSNQIHKMATDDMNQYERIIIIFKNEFLNLISSEYMEVKKFVQNISTMKKNIIHLPENELAILLNKIEEYNGEKAIGNKFHKISKFLDVLTFILEKYHDNE